MVHIGDTGHDDEWQVMEKPADDRVNTSIVNVVNLVLAELSEAALPADNVPGHSQADETQSRRRSPIDEGVAKEEVLHDVIVPAAHAQAYVKNRPLPPLRGKVILLVRIGNQSIVGGHHCDIEMNEIVDERRLVLAGLRRRHCVNVSMSYHSRTIISARKLTLLVPVSFHVPVCVGIARIVVLGASHLDLTETPLRQVDVASTEIAPHHLVLQAESSSQGAESALVLGRNVPHNLNLPVVLIITHSQVAIRRDLLVGLRNWGGNIVTVQIAAGLSVDQTDHIAVTEKSGLRALVVVGVATVGVEEPVVVGILMVVAGNLLLVGSLRVCLYVGVQKTTITFWLASGNHLIRQQDSTHPP